MRKLADVTIPVPRRRSQPWLIQLRGADTHHSKLLVGFDGASLIAQKLQKKNAPTVWMEFSALASTIPGGAVNLGQGFPDWVRLGLVPDELCVYDVCDHGRDPPPPL